MLVRQDSALSKVLLHLSPDDALFQMQPFVANANLVPSLCQKLFGANIDDNSPQNLRNKSIMQYLLHSFNVISTNNQDLHTYEVNTLVTHLNALKNENTYLSLEEALELAQKGTINTQNTFITMSDKDLSEGSRKQAFETLLHQHPELTLIFDVGQRFVTDGVLSMQASDLPSNLKHLVLTNAQGNATSIGDDFLFGASSLTSFDSSGLTNLTSIGDAFLFQASSLTSFDSSGLTNLTSIGDAFLFQASRLTSFDSSGLTNVTSIGDDFLFGASSLTSFDSSGLTNLTSIGKCFLFQASSLTSFDSSALTKVTSIDDAFLYNAYRLTSFDSFGLTNVTSIGNYFLVDVPEFDSKTLKAEILLKGRK